MVEQSKAGLDKTDIVFITGCDNVFVSYRSTWMSDVLYSELARTVHIVAEWQEGIRTHHDPGQLVEPLQTLLLNGSLFRGSGIFDGRANWVDGD